MSLLRCSGGIGCDIGSPASIWRSRTSEQPSRRFHRPAGFSTEIAERNAVKMPTDVLQCGSCEEIKLGVHAGALALAVVMGVYNAAAWLSRRQRHLAINAVLYAALTAWEQRHVVHHLRELRRPSPIELDGPPMAELEPAPKLAA